MINVMKNMVLIFCIFVCSASLAVAAVDYNQPLTADVNTVGLWNMNTIVRDADPNVSWIDDSSLDPAKRLYIGQTYVDAVPPGVTIEGATAALGNAVYTSGFDVAGWENFEADVWSSNYDTVKVEAWVKIDTILSLTRNLIETNSWWIQRWSNGSVSQIGLFVKFTEGSGEVWTSDITTSDLDNQWIHITAEFDRNKHMSITVFNKDKSFYQTAQADYPGKFMEMGGSTVTMGWKVPVSFDEVRISGTDYTPLPAPAWLSLNQYTDTAMGTYGLWHLDSVANGITPDDDSHAAAPRNFDMQLGGYTSIDNSDSKFGSSLVVNGFGDYAESVANFPYGLPLSKFNVEGWFKVPSSIFDFGNGMFYVISHDPTFFIAVETYNDVLYADFRVRSPEGFKQVETIVPSDWNWHHIAGSFDHGMLKIYLDGVQKNVGVLPGNASVASAPEAKYIIGADSSGSSNFWGRIDEVRVSAFNLSCGDLGYLPSDFNHDCIVNFEDLAEIASQWMQNTLH